MTILAMFLRKLIYLLSLINYCTLILFCESVMMTVRKNIKLNASNHISDNQEISLYIKKQIMSFPLDMFCVILPEKDSLHRSNTRVVSKTRKVKVRKTRKLIVFFFHASKISIIFASIKLMQVLVRRQLTELTTQTLKLKN